MRFMIWGSSTATGTGTAPARKIALATRRMAVKNNFICSMMVGIIIVGLCVGSGVINLGN